jgi:glycine/D-amino acid oxidase-like deaminating enzyme
VSASTLVVGAGIFGMAAALELRRRGHRVTVESGRVVRTLARRAARGVRRGREAARCHVSQDG